MGDDVSAICKVKMPQDVGKWFSYTEGRREYKKCKFTLWWAEKVGKLSSNCSLALDRMEHKKNAYDSDRQKGKWDHMEHKKNAYDSDRQKEKWEQYSAEKKRPRCRPVCSDNQPPICCDKNCQKWTEENKGKANQRYEKENNG